MVVQTGDPPASTTTATSQGQHQLPALPLLTLLFPPPRRTRIKQLEEEVAALTSRCVQLEHLVDDLQARLARHARKSQRNGPEHGSSGPCTQQTFAFLKD